MNHTLTKEEEKNTFLKGLPELHIIKLVRRVHSAEQCPHKGNCLKEETMLTELTDFITELKSTAVQDAIKELKRIREDREKHLFDDVIEVYEDLNPPHNNY